MNKTDVNHSKDELFERESRWGCQRDDAPDKPCGKPATHVVEWRHQDGDRERRILCEEHATAEQNYWSAQTWDAGVHVSSIDDWVLVVGWGARVAARVGKNVPPSGRDPRIDLSDVTYKTFPTFTARNVVSESGKDVSDSPNTRAR